MPDQWVKGREQAGKALGVSGETVRKFAFEPWWKKSFARRKGRYSEYNITQIKAAHPRFAREEKQEESTDLSRKLTLQKRITEAKIADAKLKRLNRESLDVDRLIVLMAKHEKMLAHNCEQIPIQLSKLTDDEPTKRRLLKEGTNIVRRILRMHADDVRRSLAHHTDAA